MSLDIDSSDALYYAAILILRERFFTFMAGNNIMPKGSSVLDESCSLSQKTEVGLTYILFFFLYFANNSIHIAACH